MRPISRIFPLYSLYSKSTIDPAVSPAGRHRQRINALTLSTLLFFVYLLTFEGRFTSIDELNLYSMAESWVQTGSFEVPQVEFAAYHNPVGQHEVGYAIVAAPLYAVARWTNLLNNIYAVMLLNPLLTAASAGLIYLSAVTLNLSSRAAAFAGFGYGFASLAWPYTQTFLREPLVGFLMILALTAFIHGRGGRDPRWSILGIAALLLTPLVKINVIFSLAFIPLAGLNRLPRPTLRSISLVSGGLLILFAAFQALAFARLNTVISPLNYLNVETAQLVILRSYGQLFSPIKGLLFYMPLVIWAIPGLIALALDDKRRTAAWAIGLSFGSLLLLVGLYPAWYGGQAWGPRLLVPVLPLLALGWAAAWDQLSALGWRIGMGLTFSGSAFIQLLVVTNDWWNGYAPIAGLSPDPENGIGLSYRHLMHAPPIQLLLNWRLEDFDLIWLHHDWATGWEFNLLIPLVLIVGGFVIGALWRSERLLQKPTRLAPILAVVVGLQQLLAAPTVLSYPGLSSDHSHAIADWINTHDAATVPYTMVTMSNEFHTFYMNGLLSGDYVHHWISPVQTEGFNTLANHTKGDQLYFVADRVHIDPTDSGKELEWWLNDRFYRYDSTWHGEYEAIRYGIIPEEAFTWQTVDADFGPVHIRQIATSAERVEAGEIVGIQLEICRTETPLEVHQLFVHLMGPSGMIHGLDGPIRYGGIELSDVEVGQCILEKRGVRVPDDANSGEYEVVFGLTTLDGPLTLTHDPSQTYAIASGVDIQDERLTLFWLPAAILTRN